jgi:signal transduction histidine kinase
MRGNPSALWMVVAIAMLALLPLLAVLQYRWVGEVSQAERERMQANLRTASAQFSREFDHELTRAGVTFRMDGATLSEKDWDRWAAHYEEWTRTAPDPELLRRVGFIEASEAGEMRFLAFNATTKRLEPAEWPASYGELRNRLEALTRQDMRFGQPGARLTPQSLRPMMWNVQPDIPALVMPLFQWQFRGGSPGGRGFGRPPDGAPRRPPFAGAAVLELNVDFLKNDFFPQLARKHFAGDRGMDYQVAVVTKSEPRTVVYSSDPGNATEWLGSADTTADLLGLRPEEYARLSLEAAAGPPAPGAEDMEPGRGPPPAEETPGGRTTRRRFGGGSGRGTGFPFGRFTPRGEQWQLVVKHRSGSLENVVASMRQRNLAVSFGILLLLGAAVAMILVSTRRAQRLASMQIEFVAGVSHELRTPLAVICSAADNLAAGVVAGAEQTRLYGSLIRDEGRRLADMIAQILAFAKAQSSRPTYDLRPVEVESIIESALAVSKPAIQEAGVEVAKQIAPDLPPVMADQASLTNCVQNLLSNALKYGNEGGWVAVKASAEPGHNGREVQISVEDRGPGIDPQDLPHIFEPFYRGARATSAQIHGTGLGLSLVKDFMEAQGGRVTVKSEPGKGSAFTLHVPAAGAGHNGGDGR